MNKWLINMFFYLLNRKVLVTFVMLIHEETKQLD